MKTVQYFFSGKGSSLKTALVLARKLGNTAVVPIRHDTDPGQYPGYAQIGIITPVIDFTIPKTVLSWIDRLKPQTPNAYWFAIVTNGGMPCAALTQVEKRLRKNRLELSAGFLLRCGETVCRSKAWIEQIAHMADVIAARQTHTVKPSVQDKVLTGVGNLAARLIIPSQDKKFRVKDTCVGCGICQQICPAGNIKLVNQSPVWLHACEQCGACFNWCPEEAIVATNLAARKRSRIPDVELRQMIRAQVTEGNRLLEEPDAEEPAKATLPPGFARQAGNKTFGERKDGKERA